MPERWYMCAVLPPGTNIGVDDFFRPKIFDYQVAHVSVIQQDPGSPTGEPAKNPDGSYKSCLVLVNTLHHAPLLIDSDIDAFPDFVLDIRLNAIGLAARTGLLARLKNRHKLDVDFVTSADAMRDLIRGIGKQLDSNFDEQLFEVNG